MMNAKDFKPQSVVRYISTFPKETQALLKKIRAVILEAAPMAEEKISYGMPAYFLEGPLVYFGGFQQHIGFYPTAAGISAFQKEFAGYKSSRGAVQFPLDSPIPYALIKRIVKSRIKQNLEKEKAKMVKNMKTCPKGHSYHKSSDCPTCPVCEAALKPSEGLLSMISAPARRALESKKIKTPKQLAKYSEAEILSLHGMGPGSLPKLRQALQAQGLSFRKNKNV